MSMMKNPAIKKEFLKKLSNYNSANNPSDNIPSAVATIEGFINEIIDEHEAYGDELEQAFVDATAAASLTENLLNDAKNNLASAQQAVVDAQGRLDAQADVVSANEGKYDSASRFHDEKMIELEAAQNE